MVVNLHREDALKSAGSASRWLLSHGAEVVAESEVAEVLGVESVETNLVSQSDLVICFGGDGTLIRAAHLCSELGTPILGVYFGRFGFVTQCTGDELGPALSMVLDGTAQYDERMMLQTELVRNGEPIAVMHSLNESVLQRSATHRMMVFGVHIDGIQVTRYPADGVMVATPTGSTAYNLSAGGPIVDPTIQTLILTALAPHTLAARPLVLHPDSSIMLEVETAGDAVLSVDGQTRLHLLSGDKVHITKSPRHTKLFSVAKNDFLEKLSSRLFYGITSPEVQEL